MDGGLSRFPASLALPLTVHRGATAERIERRGRAWRVHVAGGGFVDGDGVVCATTASVARRLRPELPWPSHPITYTSSITVTVRVAVAPPPTALLPASGDETSVASINPVVEGGRPTRLVRICSSGGAARRLLDTDDEEAAAVLLTAASGIVPWCDGAHVVHLRRWTEALPNFPVGAIRAIERRGWLGDDRLAMAGDYLGGPSLEGAFRSGRSAALRVLDQLL
jgi:oxygen-dependent protoporphyrinogen oxidase